jgi:hypothetical protein
MEMATPSMRQTADELPTEIKAFLGEGLTTSFRRLICQALKTPFLNERTLVFSDKTNGFHCSEDIIYQYMCSCLPAIGHAWYRTVLCEVLKAIILQSRPMAF